MSQWRKWAGYDSAKQCNQESQDYYEMYLKAKQLGPENSDEIARTAGFTADERRIFGPWIETAFACSTCVPTDDPRLVDK